MSQFARCWSTAAFGVYGDEAARALPMARVLSGFERANHVVAHRHDVCAIRRRLTLWGVGVSPVEVRVAADDVTLVIHITNVVRGVWFELQFMMCSCRRGELLD